MNNIYVDEVPDSCFYCDFFIRENYCCWLMQKDAREYRDDCPLIPITDRLAEERKKVVQEIRERLTKYTLTNDDFLFDTYYKAVDVEKVLDQIERNIDD